MTKSSGHRARCLAGVAGAMWLSVAVVSAFLPTLTERQMGEALAIARGAVPAQLAFHAPYLHTLDIQPKDAYFRIDRLEVITLFRHLELIGVEHANANDSFGRGGYRDVREALKPWLGKVSLAVHVQIFPTMQFAPQLPAIGISVRGRTVLRPIAVRPIPGYNDSGVLMEGAIESDFDSAALDGDGYQAIVTLDGKQAAAIAIDLRALR